MGLGQQEINVLIGGYLSSEAAHEDYESVLGSGGPIEGAVVVSKDLEGNLSVEQTDHMVRKGAAGLAGPVTSFGMVAAARVRGNANA